MAGPLPPAPKCVKVNLGWQCDANTKAESIVHFQYTGGPPTGADLTSIATSLQGFAVTDFGPLLWTANGVELVTVLDIDSNLGAQGSGGTPTLGTRTGAPNVASTCAVINHQIARRYRGGKPRTYAPFGISSDINSTGTWSTTFTALVLSKWISWITSALTLTTPSCTLHQYVNVSYYSGKALRPTPQIDAITGSSVRTRIGTQRRRNKTA